MSKSDITSDITNAIDYACNKPDITAYSAIKKTMDELMTQKPNYSRPQTFFFNELARYHWGPGMLGRVYGDRSIKLYNYEEEIKEMFQSNKARIDEVISRLDAGKIVEVTISSVDEDQEDPCVYLVPAAVGSGASKHRDGGKKFVTEIGLIVKSRITKSVFGLSVYVSKYSYTGNRELDQVLDKLDSLPNTGYSSAFTISDSFHSFGITEHIVGEGAEGLDDYFKKARRDLGFDEECKQITSGK